MSDDRRQTGDMRELHSRRTVFEPTRQMEQSHGDPEAHGTYEPDDSRNVTGAAGQGVGAPGGSDQQQGGERWGGGDVGSAQTPNAAGVVDQQTAAEGATFAAAGRQQQFADGSGRQMGAGEAFGQIREHMEVIGADGVHLGTVDQVEGDRIKLTRADSGMGSHAGHHHYIPRGLVAEVEGDRVRLSANADVAYAMREEQ